MGHLLKLNTHIQCPMCKFWLQQVSNLDPRRCKWDEMDYSLRSGAAVILVGLGKERTEDFCGFIYEYTWCLRWQISLSTVKTAVDMGHPKTRTHRKRAEIWNLLKSQTRHHFRGKLARTITNMRHYWRTKISTIFLHYSVLTNFMQQIEVYLKSNMPSSRLDWLKALPPLHRPRRRSSRRADPARGAPRNQMAG